MNEEEIRQNNLKLDMIKFKNRFRGDIKRCPFAHKLYSMNPNVKIDDLNLSELITLGFNSEHLTKSDFEKEMINRLSLTEEESRRLYYEE